MFPAALLGNLFESGWAIQILIGDTDGERPGLWDSMPERSKQVTRDNAYKMKDKRAPITRGDAAAIMAPPMLIGGEKIRRRFRKSWTRSNVCSLIASQ
ncbi:MAG TPA: hypothetical protein VIM74_01395 [Casimicrobiaceae bacterium]